MFVPVFTAPSGGGHAQLTQPIALNGTFVFQACLLSEAQEIAMHFSCLLSKIGEKMSHAILVFISVLQPWGC